MFRTIRENFVCSLPGYKGPDIYSRGISPDKDAYYYIHEIDDLFREWIATYWQVRQHDGLFLPCVPSLELTPNQMLAEGIARAGFMHVLPEQDMYYQLLPVVWRDIHGYGVDVNGLRYDAPILGSFSNVPSPYTEPVTGKWPFRQDPRDKSLLFFYDPDLKNWNEIPWTGAGNKHRPFDDKTLAYAKEVAFKRFSQLPESKGVETVLNELLDGIENISTADRKERRVLAEAMMKSQLAKRDRKKSSEKPVTPKDPFGSSGGPSTAPKGASRSDKLHSSKVPVLIGAISDDPGEDVESESCTKWDDTSAQSKSTKMKIKSLDEATEDDEDDLKY